MGDYITPAVKSFENRERERENEREKMRDRERERERGEGCIQGPQGTTSHQTWNAV